jgi:hypothetical protein
MPYVPRPASTRSILGRPIYRSHWGSYLEVTIQIRFISTCDKIRETAHKHGIKAVMHCASASFAAGAVKRGFDMVMLTSDLSCMIAGARLQLDELKAKTA